MQKHPHVPFHEVIDIIRPLADREYLDTISEFAKDGETSLTELLMPSMPKQHLKQFIYLDRNNTPDVWADIANAIKYSQTDRADFKTILILPE